MKKNRQKLRNNLAIGYTFSWKKNSQLSEMHDNSTPAHDAYSPILQA